jgi:hypothetical protein
MVRKPRLNGMPRLQMAELAVQDPVAPQRSEDVSFLVLDLLHVHPGRSRAGAEAPDPSARIVTDALRLPLRAGRTASALSRAARIAARWPRWRSRSCCRSRCSIR